MSDQASTIMVNTLEPQSGTTLTVGKSGQNLVVNADSLKANVAKDAGGNAVFTSNGSGTLSGLNSAFGSAQTLISSQTASNIDSISFTSGIDNTYKEYVFEFINITGTSAGAHMSFQAGSSYDTTMTTTNFQAKHAENDTGSALEYDSGWDQAQGTGLQQLLIKLGTGSDQSGAGELHLFSPSSTTYVKHFYFRGNTNASNDYSYDSYTGGYLNTTAALTQVQFKATAGNLGAGTIKMYGIK